MRDLLFTAHAVKRFAQRSLRSTDAEIATLLGIEVKDGSLLTRRTCESVARDLRRLADRVSRLHGTFCRTDGNTVVTGYRTRRRKQQRLIRGAEERNFEHPTR
jgi:hypothetical protein